MNGEPQVTEDGDIVYVFPELQQSASSSSKSSARASASALVAAQENLILKRVGLPANASAGEIKRLLAYNGIDTRGALERSDLLAVLEDAAPEASASEQAFLDDLRADSQVDALVEREYKFSIAPDMNRFLAAGLGVLNLGGALYLGNLLSQYSLYGVQLPSYMGLVQGAYPLLLAYAVLFNVIPAVRNAWIQRENALISARNKVRQDWKNELRQTMKTVASRDTRLGRKLRAAAKMGSGVRQLGVSEKDILFDTSKPMEETKQKKEQQELEDFDKLLESDDSFQ